MSSIYPVFTSLGIMSPDPSYKDDVFEEINYDSPLEILDRLIQAEVGEVAKRDLQKVQSGIVRELLELREMIR